MPETPKQRLRRLLDRLKLDDKNRRKADSEIERMSDEDAATFIDFLDDLESGSPGAIEDLIKEISEHGIPDDD